MRSPFLFPHIRSLRGQKLPQGKKGGKEKTFHSFPTFPYISLSLQHAKKFFSLSWLSASFLPGKGECLHVTILCLLSFACLQQYGRMEKIEHNLEFPWWQSDNNKYIFPVLRDVLRSQRGNAQTGERKIFLLQSNNCKADLHDIPTFFRPPRPPFFLQAVSPHIRK